MAIYECHKLLAISERNSAILETSGAYEEKFYTHETKMVYPSEDTTKLTP